MEIASLRSLKIPGGNGHKSQFVDALVQERTKREQKLAKAFDIRPRPNYENDLNAPLGILISQRIATL